MIFTFIAGKKFHGDGKGDSISVWNALSTILKPHDIFVIFSIYDVTLE